MNQLVRAAAVATAIVLTAAGTLIATSPDAFAVPAVPEASTATLLGLAVPVIGAIAVLRLRKK